MAMPAGMSDCYLFRKKLRQLMGLFRYEFMLRAMDFRKDRQRSLA